MNIKRSVFEKTIFPMHQQTRLSIISRSSCLRCDAKQSEKRFSEFLQVINSVDSFELGEYLPNPFIKGTQPKYLEINDPDGIPVINTLSIQKMNVLLNSCRFISDNDFQSLEEEKKILKGDILLTLDGGTSIGKPVMFPFSGEYTMDSHIAILRPVGLDSKTLLYLLASPIGQLQFNMAESGASGQTAVTEDDIRRFRFPKLNDSNLSENVKRLDEKRTEILSQYESLEKLEEQIWEDFNLSLFEKH